MALAALVSAGMTGIRAAATLPEPVMQDPATISPEDAAAMQLERLPDSLTAAIEALLDDAGAPASIVQLRVLHNCRAQAL